MKRAGTNKKFLREAERKEHELRQRKAAKKAEVEKSNGSPAPKAVTGIITPIPRQ
jgi:hypothetical protein